MPDTFQVQPMSCRYHPRAATFCYSITSISESRLKLSIHILSVYLYPLRPLFTYTVCTFTLWGHYSHTQCVPLPSEATIHIHSVYLYPLRPLFTYTVCTFTLWGHYSHTQCVPLPSEATVHVHNIFCLHYHTLHPPASFTFCGPGASFCLTCYF